MKYYLGVTLIAALSNSALIAQTYPIVDTAQETFYNDLGNEINQPQQGSMFYGQDAHFAGNGMEYTISEDLLTIYDNVTGLTWTRSADWNNDGTIDVDDKFTFDAAMEYPSTLNSERYGGFDDWRAPTMKELYSLMNFTGTDASGSATADGLIPFIDTEYFEFGYGDEDSGERLIDAQFWSSNEYTGLVFGNQEAAFGLNLADGRIKGYPSESQIPESKLNYMYYVRGNTSYGINDFTDNGDNTITDNATHLMWAKYDNGEGLNWGDALDWVAEKNAENYLGYSDWRLPNAKELHSLVDYSRSPEATNSAAIDPVFEISSIVNESGEMDYPFFWTGTTHIGYNGMGMNSVYICFGKALGYFPNDWTDVHGAGAQRSDPKTGDPDNYPEGNGPQGDAIRIYNYIRLVRDAQIITNNEEETSTIKNFELQQNYPNPFNPSTIISFSLFSSEQVSLKIYNSIGQEVSTLINGTLAMGSYSFEWKADSMPGGVYFYTLFQAGSPMETRKMILLK
ncbi:MAG: DUF1566 domain-containing protein [Balneolales bacterium]|nr:DUF1566 domain-containing protein [Balneolales bacterium]